MATKSHKMIRMDIRRIERGTTLKTHSDVCTDLLLSTTSIALYRLDKLLGNHSIDYGFMLILLGSALGSPTFSSYAVTTNHVKSLKEPDKDFKP